VGRLHRGRRPIVSGSVFMGHMQRQWATGKKAAFSSPRCNEVRHPDASLASIQTSQYLILVGQLPPPGTAGARPGPVRASSQAWPRAANTNGGDDDQTSIKPGSPLRALGTTPTLQDRGDRDPPREGARDFEGVAH
jgi:hypothetical protein